MSTPPPRSAVSSAGAPQINLKIDNDKSFVANIADCLHFSNAFSLAGFETVNDTVLKEMNERVRAQRTREHSAAARHGDAAEGSASTKDAMQATLQNLARINRSPPESRFSAAHHHEFAQSESIMANSKRQGNGEESPSKRRRAPGGAAIGIPNSPTRHLKQLSLGRDDLERVSVARQRDKQRKEQTSPRRRLRAPPTQQPPARDLQTQPSLQPRMRPVAQSHTAPSSTNPSMPPLKHVAKHIPSMPGSFPTVPTLQFDLPKPDDVEQTRPQQTRPQQTKPHRPLPRAPEPSLMPRSQTTRSLSPSMTHAGPTLHAKSTIPHSHSQQSIPRSQPTSSVPRSGPQRSVSAHTQPSSSKAFGTQRSVSAGDAAATTLSPSRSQRVSAGAASTAPKSTPHASLRSSSTMPRSSSTMPRSSSQRSISAAPRHEASLLPPFPENLPSYARPTQATLRRSQSLQPTSASARDPRTRSVSAQDAKNPTQRS